MRKFIILILFSIGCACTAQVIGPKDFKTSEHPRIFVTKADRLSILNKIRNVG